MDRECKLMSNDRLVSRFLTTFALWAATVGASAAIGWFPLGIAFGTAPTFQSFSTPGITSTTVPVGATWVEVTGFGGGGGAGSGRVGATSSVATAGTGGPPGKVFRQTIPASLLGAAGTTVPIVVGRGGVGGAAVAVNDTNGNPGGLGGTSGIGTVLSCTASGTANGITGIVWSSRLSLYIEVGIGGVIQTSSDGRTFTSRTSNTTNQLNAVFDTGTQIVAVGITGTIVTSPDGVTAYTVQTSGTTQNLNSGLWDGTSAVVVGNAGTILTSTVSAAVWVPNAFASANNILDVGWDGSTNHVAVTSGGEVVTATIATLTWTATAITASSTYGLATVTFGAGKWLTAGTIGIGFTATNPNGAWSATPTFSSAPMGARFVNGYFIVSYTGGLAPVYYSSDAVTWYITVTPGVSGVGIGPGLVDYGNGQWTFTKRADNAAQPTACTLYTTAIVNYSLVAVGGPPGLGGGTATALSPVDSTSGPSAGTGYGNYWTDPAGGAGTSAPDTGTGYCMGGPAGGSITAANALQRPGFGSQPIGFPSIAVNGTSGGATPGDGISLIGSQIYWGGASGGGGAAALAANGQDGGFSGSPCSGGAGGAGARNGFSSGKGSTAGNGEVRLVWHYN